MFHFRLCFAGREREERVKKDFSLQRQDFYDRMKLAIANFYGRIAEKGFLAVASKKRVKSNAKSEKRQNGKMEKTMKQTTDIPQKSGGEYIECGGCKQYLQYIPGNKDNLPVMLILNPVPGIPASLISHHEPPEVSDYYTRVYWDEPGSGKTLQKNKGYFPDLEERLSTLKEIVDYLKGVYGKDRLILQACSFGTILGSLYTIKHPEDLLCYIGLSQIVSFQDQEAADLVILKNLAINAGKKKDFNRLEALKPYPYEAYGPAYRKKFETVAKIRKGYQGGRDGKEILDLMKSSPDFHMADRLALLKGVAGNRDYWEDIMKCNLTETDGTYQVPVYYLLGESDSFLSQTLLKKYFNTLRAPQKELFELPDAGHCMMLDNGEEYLKVLKVIRGMLMMFRM